MTQTQILATTVVVGLSCLGLTAFSIVNSVAEGWRHYHGRAPLRRVFGITWLSLKGFMRGAGISTIIVFLAAVGMGIMLRFGG